MSQPFTEVVIEAPFALVKGFLMGFMQGRGKEFPYFFHRKHGIKRETVGEFLKEALHLECTTHLCLPDAVLPEFTAALKGVEDRFGVRIKQQRPIMSASFRFSWHVYSEERSGPCKELFRNLPEGVELLDFRPAELRSSIPAGVAEFSTLNPYCFAGSGTVSGDFEGVMEMFLRIKRSTLCDSILLSEIKLEFE